MCSADSETDTGAHIQIGRRLEAGLSEGERITKT